LIIIGLGANLPGPASGPPRATCGAALEALEAAGIRVVRRSRWYHSPPQPISDQPWFVNGAAVVETDLAPSDLMGLLLETETALGRERGGRERGGRERRVRNAARVLDLDLIAYHDLVQAETASAPALPHPRLDGRAFVLLPIAEIAPEWTHPATGAAVRDLIAALPADQTASPLEDAEGRFGTEWRAA